MKNKGSDNNILGIALGVFTIVCFVGSIFTFGRDYYRDKKISEQGVYSISDIEAPEVPNVTPARENGVITAKEWSEYYPNEYATYMLNENNKGTADGRVKYTETNPDIQTLYQGMGFAFDYTEAIGHNYTLEDINITERPHKLANCLTCKTPDFSAMVNAMGTEAYSLEFDQVNAQMEEPISCYSCHANEPGTIHIVHDYMASAMGDEIESKAVNAADIACAQCHIEYYFDPTTKATTTPYQDLEGISPDAILAYYEKMGFVDYTNENTGVGMIKVQHPEFETFYGEGSQHAKMYTCADCHMSFDYDTKNYKAYVDHELVSPLDNPDLLKNQCALCHKDLRSEVAAIQTEITGRENEISAMLVELNGKLADAIAAGSFDEKTLEQIKSLDRQAQYYWDFVFVENSEGAHNSKLSRECLDKAEELAKQALAFF